jgi:hypothetical protein
MGAFYIGIAIYDPSKFEGLSSKRFAEAVTAEFNGAHTSFEGVNYCLHTHEYFKSYDFLNIGKPSRIAFSDRDARLDDEKADPSMMKYCLSVPWFKKFDKEWIETYFNAYKKVADNYRDLLEGDTDKVQGGRWYGFANEKIQQKAQVKASK